MFKQLSALAALFVAVSSPAQQSAAPAGGGNAAELYGVRETVEQIDLSPDGRHVVILSAGPGRQTVVYYAEVGSTAAPRIVTAVDGDPERIRSCEFATNDRLVCVVSGMLRSPSGYLLPFSRRIALDTDGRNAATLGQTESFYDAYVRLSDGEILDLQPGTGSVLMARSHMAEAGLIGTHLNRTASGLAVDRVDLRTLRATAVEEPNDRAAGYITDGQGEVRIMALLNARGATGRMQSHIDYVYRRNGSREWVPLGSYDMVTGDGMLPRAVDRASNSAYVLKKLNGRVALYRIKLDGSLAEELVYANDTVDVDDVVFSGHGAHVIGVSFADERRRVVYFDPAFTALGRSLSRAIPNLPLIDFSEASIDGNRVLVHAGSDTDAGRFYVYDRTAHSLNEILMVRPQLENVPGATVRSVSYPAADGTQIPAYLTLPPGAVDARNLPAVILPHGGPASRDEWGFAWLPQYLAHQGYAVLQPNYRGSAGYGDSWLRENGFRSWRISIGDITAGARWLAAQGIANPQRMAIVGWSYGGYAALQSAATEPALFRAVVAIAPVTDLQQFKDDFRDYSNSRNVAEYIGAGPHIAQGSPLRNAAAITAPVLLFHGDRDLNVNIIHSRHMDDALRGAGKRSELTVFRGLEHDLADSSVRTRMLQRIGDFLQAELAAH